MKIEDLLNSFDLVTNLNKIIVSLNKMHFFVHDVCPARMGDKEGILGLSELLYYRIFLDTKDESITLYSSYSKINALRKYKEYKNKYELKI